MVNEFPAGTERAQSGIPGMCEQQEPNASGSALGSRYINSSRKHRGMEKILNRLPQLQVPVGADGASHLADLGRPALPP